MAYEDVKVKLHGRTMKKIANNTYLEYDSSEDCIDMHLHGYYIAMFNKDYVELSSCGWDTSTTKRRLNMALDIAHIPLSVYQHDYIWYIGNTNPKLDKPFFDGIRLTYDGNIINRFIGERIYQDYDY